MPRDRAARSRGEEGGIKWLTSAMWTPTSYVPSGSLKEESGLIWVNMGQ